MPLTFPTSPTNGQTVTLSGTTYTYNATKGVWEATASGGGFVAGSFSEHILPATDDTYDIGSASYKIRDLYVSDNSLHIGDHTMSADSEGINIPALKLGTGSNRVKLTANAEGKLRQIRTVGGVAQAEEGISSDAGTTTVDTFAELQAAPVVAGKTVLVKNTNKLYINTGTGWYVVGQVTNESPTAITGLDATYNLAKDGTATVITMNSTDPEGFPLTWSHAVTTGTLGSTATITNTDNVFTITPSSTEADAGTFSVTFSASDGSQAATSVSDFTLSFTSWVTASLQTSIVPGGLNIDGVDNSNDYAGAHGMSLSQDMNHLVISGMDKTISTQNSSYWNYDGSIRYYTRSGNTWTLQQYFNGPTPPSAVLSFGNQYGQRFGQGATISGDASTFVCASSAWQNSDTNGSAIHIYTRSGNTWTLQETIPSDSSTWSTNQDYGGRLGSFAINQYKGKTFATPLALSYDGSFLAIGSPDFNTTPGTGAVHTFTRSGSTWSFEQYITGPDTRFGHGVAYAEDTQTLMIGDARHPDESNWPNLYGGLGFYRRNGSGVWSVDQTVVSANAGDFLGGSCTISKDGMTAAAGGNNDSTTQMVSVYVNDGTANGGNWTLQQRFRNSDWVDTDGKFGSIVQLSNDGDTLMVAAKDQDATIDSTLYTNAGRIYVFKRTGTTWTETGIIDLPSGDRANGRNLGQKCVLSSDASLIFANSDGTAYNGAIHIYEEG